MNSVNHGLVALALTLLFVNPHALNILWAVATALVFGVLIDVDHHLNRGAPWFHRRTWVQEPLGFLVLGVPTALTLARLLSAPTLAWLVLTPYASHIMLDYLCVFEAFPLAPLTHRVVKREGSGLFYPDDLWRSENAARWFRRVKERGYRAVSENYFTPVAAALLATVAAVKLVF